MKRFLILGICMIACSALAARADTININNTDNGTVMGTFTMTRTVNYNSSGLDRLVFKLASFTGDAAGSTMSGLEGIWAAMGSGKKLNVGTGYRQVDEDTGDKWVVETNKYHYSNEANISYMNFESTIGAVNLDPATGLVYDAGSNLRWSRTGAWDSVNGYWTGTTTDNLKGGWGTTSPLSGTSTFATMFVTTGGDMSFTGQLSLSYGGGSVPHVYFATAEIPEPSTLALLAAGLVGMVAYAWRKRK